MLDPIQRGLRIIRLGCLRFMIEYRSLPIPSPSRNQCNTVFFCSRARDRAPALLNCSPARNQCDPDCLFLSLSRTGPVLRAFAYERILAASRLSRNTARSHLFFLFFRTGENLDDAATLFGSDPGWNWTLRY